MGKHSYGDAIVVIQQQNRFTVKQAQERH